jgi:hypothetical protein
MKLLKMFVRLIILACLVVGMSGCSGGGGEPKKGTAQDKVSAPPVKPSQKKVNAAE